jgi:hypothetical protein
MTKIIARRVLYRRVGEYIALADVADALAHGAREAGLAVASGQVVTDEELALLPAGDETLFYRAAELRIWESILGNATDTGLRDVALDDSPRDVRDLAKERIAALSKSLKDDHGIGVATISLGTIGLDFAARPESPGDDI